MNFPDLETCQAIASEFPESEFVYDNRLDLRTGKNMQVSKREDVPYKGNTVCSAPSCEELGEWLWKERHQLCQYESGWSIFKLYTKERKDTQFGTTLVSRFMSNNETQARAEAVKLILEGMK